MEVPEGDWNCDFGRRGKDAVDEVFDVSELYRKPEDGLGTEPVLKKHKEKFEEMEIGARVELLSDEANSVTVETEPILKGIREEKETAKGFSDDNKGRVELLENEANLISVEGLDEGPEEAAKCILFLFMFLFQKHWEGEDEASVSVSVSEADESWTQSKPGLVFTTKRSGLVFIYQDHSLFKERQEWLGKGVCFDDLNLVSFLLDPIKKAKRSFPHGADQLKRATEEQLKGAGSSRQHQKQERLKK
ncbi:hypothetical protein IGI04_030474 [Brassica rapa subsp. trilocularis]|uniref:Uncharacterized protein n=1 Tax=Brassica rapa subsp. trilocularis TaxID=1813537 RepID=A0ABQ7LTI4_BRACM|nr:hypothetical protein IGI04_030474 [Brassica rapa subsp. trilocularis]